MNEYDYYHPYLGSNDDMHSDNGPDQDMIYHGILKSDTSGQCESSPYGNDEAAARLYFQVFDVDNSGTISIGELRLVVACLLQEGSGFSGNTKTPTLSIASPLHAHAEPTTNGDDGDRTCAETPDIELGSRSAPTEQDEVAQLSPTVSLMPDMSIDELFAAIDVSGSGQINFEEFLIFYHAVMKYSTTKSASIRFDPDVLKSISSRRLSSECTLSSSNCDSDDDSDGDDNTSCRSLHVVD